MPINNANRTIVLLIVTNLFTYGCGVSLIKALHREQQRNKKLSEMTTYMVSLLDKYDIPLTQFDAIALSDMVREHNA